MPSQKYLFLHRSPVDQQQTQQPPSPAQMQEMFAAFSAWKEKFKDKILDMGGKLKPGGTIIEVAKGMSGMMSPGARIEIREMSGP